MSNYDINWIVGTTFYTIDRIREAWWNMAWDALILYFEYIKKGRIDWTNQPRATDKYMMEWLWRGRSKFLTAKTTLKELWLIEAIPWRSNNWLMAKRYTRVNYIMPQEKIEEAMNQNPKSRLVDNNQKSEYRPMDNQNPKSGVVDKEQVWSLEVNAENEEPSSDHQKSENPPSGEMTSNALSIKNKMLKENIYNTSYYISEKSDLEKKDIEETKLDEKNENITAQDVYDAYSVEKKWTLKDLEKVTNWFSQEKFRRALLEAHLVSCEEKLKKKEGERITYAQTCANCIASMNEDEETIYDRVDAIVKWFNTFKHRSPKYKEKRDKNIKEWFKDYLPKEELKTTLDRVLEYDDYYNKGAVAAFLEKYWAYKYAMTQARRLEYTNNWRHPLRSRQD